MPKFYCFPKVKEIAKRLPVLLPEFQVKTYWSQQNLHLTCLKRLFHRLLTFFNLQARLKFRIYFINIWDICYRTGMVATVLVSWTHLLPKLTNLFFLLTVPAYLHVWEKRLITLPFLVVCPKWVSQNNPHYHPTTVTQFLGPSDQHDEKIHRVYH